MNRTPPQGLGVFLLGREHHYGHLTSRTKSESTDVFQYGHLTFIRTQENPQRTSENLAHRSYIYPDRPVFLDLYSAVCIRSEQFNISPAALNTNIDP